MWLVPSLNRPAKLREFLKSVIQAETTTPGLILIDATDYDKNNSAYLDLPMPEGWSIYLTGAHVSMGDKIRTCFNPSWEWVGVLNDDHYVITKGWDQRLIKQLDGTNFLSTADRWTAPAKASGATIWSMPLLAALGFPVYPPGMQHLFIDDLWETLGRSTGCWKVDMHVVVEHRHALKDNKLIDETHMKVYSQSAWNKDQEIYREWVKNDMEKCITKIRELRSGQQKTILHV